MAGKKYIKDLVVKVNAADVGAAASAAKNLEKSLDQAANSGVTLDNSLKRIPSYLTSALEATRSLNKELGKSANAQVLSNALNSVPEAVKRMRTAFGDLNKEFANQSKQLTSINKAAKSTKAISDSLLDAAISAELLNGQLSNTIAKLPVLITQAKEAGISLDFTRSSASTDRLETALELLVHKMDELLEYTVRSQVELGNLDTTFDKVSAEINSLNKNMKDYSMASGKAQRQTEKTNRALASSNTHAQGAARTFSKMAQSAGGYAVAYAFVAANLFAVQQSFEYLSRGDQLNRLEQMSKVMSGSLGTSIRQVASDMQELTGYAVSYEQALRTATQGATYKFQADQIEKMALVARRASIALGVDMNDALNRVMRGTSKLEIELLDELGVTVRLTQAYNDYAKSVGKTANDLTDFERQTAYLNAVVDQSTRRMGMLDDQIKGVATGWEKLGAASANASRQLSQSLASALEPVAKSLANLLSRLDEAHDKYGKAGARIRDTGEDFGEAAKQKNTGEMIRLYQTMEAEWQKANLSEHKFLSESEQRWLQWNDAASTATLGLAGLLGATYAEWRGEDERTASQILNDNARVWEAQQARIKAASELMKQFGIDTKNVDSTELTKLANAFISLKQAGSESVKEISNSTAALRTTQNEFGKLLSPMKNVLQSMKDINTEIGKFGGTQADGIKQMAFVLQDLGYLAKNDFSAQGVAAAQANLDYATQTTDMMDKWEKDENGRLKRQKQIERSLIGQNSAVQELTMNQRKRNELEEENARLNAMITANSLKVTPDDVSALQNRIVANQAAMVQLDKDDTMARQEAVDIRQKDLEVTANINALTQDMSDASLSVVKAQNKLSALQYAYGNNVARTAEEQRSLSLDMLEAERELKRARYEELSYNEQIASQKAVVMQMEQDILWYQQGSVKAGADIVEAQQQLKTLETEISYLKGMGAMGEQDLLDKMKERLDVQKKIVELTAESIKSQVEEMAIADRRKADTIGPLAQQKQSIKEISMQMDGLAESGYKASLQYKQLADQLEDARIKYQLMMDQQKANKINDVLGATGNTQLSTMWGQTQEDIANATMSNNLDNFTSAFSAIGEYNPAVTDMIGNLGQLANAMIAVGESGLKANQLVGPVLSTLGSMFAMTAQQSIDSIQSQIDMEKKLDGKSEQSKAKLAKLEEEKLAKQKKMATQQIAVQTAIGMANALGAAPPPYNFVLMGMVAAAGMMAMQQAQSGNVSSTPDAYAPESLTLGNRQNRVDVAQGANSGELSYIRGDKGSGGIQSFVPRATGGKGYAGTSVMLGEHGAEAVTLSRDVEITNSTESKRGAGGNSYSVTIQAVDARSFQQLMEDNAGVVVETVENKLNETGKSIKK